MTKNVLGIGNALTDMLVDTSDEKLTEFELPKASMQLVDAARMGDLMQKLGEACNERRCAGGCASNTITGLGEMGIQTAFIGKIGPDPIGEFFEQDLISHRVESRLLRSETPSGTALALITPDGERTFATHLGAAVELTADELTDEMFLGADFFHIEGYLVQNHALIATAIEKAKAAGSTVSIDLAAYNVVEQHRVFLQGLLGKGLDVVFANEDEARIFTETDDEQQALDALAECCSVAVVKIGAGGSLLARDGERVHVPVDPVDPVDTTGAGDLFAAGFLYGLVHDRPLEQCGRIGSLLAREIIQVVGTKLPPANWQRLMAAIEAP